MQMKKPTKPKKPIVTKKPTKPKKTFTVCKSLYTRCSGTLLDVLAKLHVDVSKPVPIKVLKEIHFESDDFIDFEYECERTVTNPQYELQLSKYKSAMGRYIDRLPINTARLKKYEVEMREYHKDMEKYNQYQLNKEVEDTRKLVEGYGN